MLSDPKTTVFGILGAIGAGAVWFASVTPALPGWVGAAAHALVALAVAGIGISATDAKK